MNKYILWRGFQQLKQTQFPIRTGDQNKDFFFLDDIFVIFLRISKKYCTFALA